MAVSAFRSSWPGVRTVVREHRDACARGHEQLVPVHHERPAHGCQQLFGEDAERLAFPHAGEQDREVIGAHARDGVILSYRSHQAPANALQELIAHRMAEARVHLLECVEIEHQHRKLLASRRARCTAWFTRSSNRSWFGRPVRRSWVA